MYVQYSRGGVVNTRLRNLYQTVHRDLERPNGVT